MAYRITDECASCKTCAEECPVQAISDGGDKYVIDQDVCLECGACQQICPLDAIVEE